MQSSKASSKAIMACANWLSYCIKIGWPKKDLDRLQELWWKYHDNDGRLLMGPEHSNGVQETE